MPDLITDERLGYIVGKLWSDYIRGLILLEEFNREVFEEMLKARGDR
jgi:hypothetical protein